MTAVDRAADVRRVAAAGGTMSDIALLWGVTRQAVHAWLRNNAMLDEYKQVRGDAIAARDSRVAARHAARHAARFDSHVAALRGLTPSQIGALGLSPAPDIADALGFVPTVAEQREAWGSPLISAGKQTRVDNHLARVVRHLRRCAADQGVPVRDVSAAIYSGWVSVTPDAPSIAAVRAAMTSAGGMTWREAVAVAAGVEVSAVNVGKPNRRVDAVDAGTAADAIARFVADESCGTTVADYETWARATGKDGGRNGPCRAVVVRALSGASWASLIAQALDRPSLPC